MGVWWNEKKVSWLDIYLQFVATDYLYLAGSFIMMILTSGVVLWS